jgi:hypothetical protein
MKFITEWKNRRRAAQEYFAADDRSGSLLWKDLPEALFAQERARILDDLSASAFVASRACAVFDTKNIDDDGFTSAQWERTESALYSLIAAAERVNHANPQLIVRDVQARQLLKNPPTTEIVMRFVRDPSFIGRSDRLVELLHAVMPEVGGQGAECLAALAAVYRILGGEDVHTACATVWATGQPYRDLD